MNDASVAKNKAVVVTCYQLPPPTLIVLQVAYQSV